MAEIPPPPSSPVHLHPALQRTFSQRLPMPDPAPSSNTVPSGLKDWYSNYVFRTVTFFILMSAVLSVSTAAFFNGKLSADQFLGIVSSLLFLATPSPLQNKGKKKIYYMRSDNGMV